MLNFLIRAVKTLSTLDKICPVDRIAKHQLKHQATWAYASSDDVTSKLDAPWRIIVTLCRGVMMGLASEAWLMAIAGVKTI